MPKQPALLNRADLAKELNVSRSTLYRMERAGCPFPAGKSTVEWALAWLKDNPQFSSPRRPEAATPSAPAQFVTSAKVASLVDIVFAGLFLIASKLVAASSELTPGPWQGQPALYAYNTARTFAVVFSLADGKPLGFWQEGA